MRGEPPLKRVEAPTNPIELAKFVLEHYGLNFNVTYCSHFKTSLNKITQLNSKQEIESNNAALTFFPSEGEWDAWFLWRFKTNNVTAFKKSFYIGIKWGVLSALGDNWERYKIGNTKINVSEEDAVNIALNIIQNAPENLSKTEAVKIIQKHFHEDGAK